MTTTGDDIRPVPAVTAVVVTYRGRDLLPGCLDSLASQRVQPGLLEVVVVDNASHDGSVELVEREHPGVTVIRSPVNLGFAGGNDLALDRLTTPYALLLNNDARARPDLLARLLAAAEEPGADRCAAFTATVLLADRFRTAGEHEAGVVRTPHGTYAADPDGDVRLVNSTGNVVTRDGHGMDRDWLVPTDRCERLSGGGTNEVFGFCGAAVLLRREALAEVGVFDPDFFMYYEDTDLSWRLRRAGWTVRHVPDAVADHVHAASSGEGSDLFHVHNDRNRLLVLGRNASAGLLVRSVLRMLLTLASTTLRRREPWSRTRLRWRALGSLLRLAPATARKRWLARPRPVVRRRQVERLLQETPATRPGAYR